MAPPPKATGSSKSKKPQAKTAKKQASRGSSTSKRKTPTRTRGTGAGRSRAKKKALAVEVIAPPPPVTEAMVVDAVLVEEGPLAIEAEPKTIGVPLEAGQLEESLKKIGEQLKRWANKGRYSRVRIKFRGRQLLPDLPLAAVMAAEGLSMYFPPARVPALLAHLAGGALLEVELINDSEKRVQEGKEALLSGDLDRALQLFRAAAEMDQDSAAAQLNIGVALKLRGDVEGARAALERARALDPSGPVGAEAEKVANTLGRR